MNLPFNDLLGIRECGVGELAGEEHGFRGTERLRAMVTAASCYIICIN